jgi:2,5-diketo-D-gluconate reductase B
MRTIDHHGSSIPVLGLGTWELRGPGCVTAVERALILGYRHVDTAQGYFNEAEVGQGLRRSGVPRDEVFLTSKLRPSNLRARAVRSSTEASLASLGATYLDLLLVHWPNREVPLEETLGAMRDLVGDGLIRHLGVSNFAPSLVRRAHELAEVFTNQVEYHPFLSQSVLLREAERLGHLLTAYSPVARGKVDDDPVLREIGAAHGKTAGQVALRWLIQQPRVVAIPKAASEANQRRNLDIFDFVLSADEMSAIHALARDERLVDDLDIDWER